jgi:hypothetical protein
MNLRKNVLVRIFTLIDKMNCKNPNDLRISKREPGIVIGEDVHSRSHVNVLWNDGTITVCWREDLMTYDTEKANQPRKSSPSESE